MVLLKGTFLPMNGIMEPAAKGSVHVPVLLKGCAVNHDAPSRAAGVRTAGRSTFKMIVIVGKCVYHLYLLINAAAFPRRAALHRWRIPSVPQNNPYQRGFLVLAVVHRPSHSL